MELLHPLKSRSCIIPSARKLDWRQGEYEEALQRVIDDPNILRVHVLIPNASHYTRLKLLIDPLKKMMPCHTAARLTYRAAAAYLNRVLPGQLVILSNADISPYSGLDLIDERRLEEKHVYAPTRWEPKHCPPGLCDCALFRDRLTWLNGIGWMGACADTFIFKAPLPTSFANSTDVDFYLGGALGGENAFMGHLVKHGYSLSNPCKNLIFFHHHCSMLRPHSWGQQGNVGGTRANSGIASCLDVVNRIEN